MQIDYTGKVVLITGGASGIGRGTAQAFAECGATVAIVDINQTNGAETLAVLQESSPGSVFIQADLSDSGACQRVVEETVSSLGGLDILFNNVGIQPAESYVNVEETPEALWDLIIDINLKSYFLVSKYAIPHMRARGGGVILNTASVQGHLSMRGVPAYAASKGGVLSLTRNMALDYARENIRVLAICPGAIDTELARIIAREAGDEEAFVAAWGLDQPIGRLGQPADIANVVLFVASDYAEFMTGAYVNVDGGAMAMGAWSSPPKEW